jgi:hypothetical protein
MHEMSNSLHVDTRTQKIILLVVGCEDQLKAVSTQKSEIRMRSSVRGTGTRRCDEGSVLSDEDKKTYVTGEETGIFRFGDDSGD